MQQSKIYLGDSVYAEWLPDTQRLKLTTENGLATDPSNTIYLERDLVALLVNWLNGKRKRRQGG